MQGSTSRKRLPNIFSTPSENAGKIPRTPRIKKRTQKTLACRTISDSYHHLLLVDRIINRRLELGVDVVYDYSRLLFITRCCEKASCLTLCISCFSRLYLLLIRHAAWYMAPRVDNLRNHTHILLHFRSNRQT